MVNVTHNDNDRITRLQRALTADRAKFETLQADIERESEVVSSLCNHIRERRINHVLIAARGSSDNAGRYAKYLFGARNQLLVSLAAPSLFTIFNKWHQPCNFSSFE